MRVGVAAGPWWRRLTVSKKPFDGPIRVLSKRRGEKRRRRRRRRDKKVCPLKADFRRSSPFRPQTGLRRKGRREEKRHLASRSFFPWAITCSEKLIFLSTSTSRLLRAPSSLSSLLKLSRELLATPKRLQFAAPKLGTSHTHIHVHLRTRPRKPSKVARLAHEAHQHLFFFPLRFIL